MGIIFKITDILYRNRTKICIKCVQFLECSFRAYTGKGGKLIKRVGELARIDIEKFLDTRVFLELYVTVKADWRRDARKLKELGGF